MDLDPFAGYQPYSPSHLGLRSYPAMAISPSGLSPINRSAQSLDSLNLSLSADEPMPSRTRIKGFTIGAPAVPVAGPRRRDSPMSKPSRTSDEDSDPRESKTAKLRRSLMEIDRRLGKRHADTSTVSALGVDKKLVRIETAGAHRRATPGGDAGGPRAAADRAENRDTKPSVRGSGSEAWEHPDGSKVSGLTTPSSQAGSAKPATAAEIAQNLAAELAARGVTRPSGARRAAPESPMDLHRDGRKRSPAANPDAHRVTGKRGVTLPDTSRRSRSNIHKKHRSTSASPQPGSRRVSPPGAPAADRCTPLQAAVSTPGGDAGGPPPPKEPSWSDVREQEAAAKVLRVEQAAERLLQEQQQNFQRELAHLHAEAQSNHQALTRQESSAITQRDKAIKDLEANSAREEAAAQQVVQQLVAHRTRLLQQENEEVNATARLQQELAAAQANAAAEAQQFAQSKDAQHRLSQQRFQLEEQQLVSELQAHQASHDAQIRQQVMQARDELMNAEQRVQMVVHDEQVQSRSLKSEYEMALHVTRSEAAVSAERVTRMKEEMSQQNVNFQRHDQEIRASLGQATASAQVAQHAMQAADSAQASVSQAMAAAASSSTAMDMKLGQLMQGMQACLQQTAAAQNQVETTKREMAAIMDSKMVEHTKHFTDLINFMRNERQSAPEVDARALRKQQRKEAQEAKEQARRNDSRPRRDRSRQPPVIKNLLTADGDDPRHPRGGDARGRTPERPPKPKAPARPKAKAHSANPTMKATASATTPRTLPRNALQSAPKSLRAGGPPDGSPGDDPDDHEHMSGSSDTGSDESNITVSVDGEEYNIHSDADDEGSESEEDSSDE